MCSMFLEEPSKLPLGLSYMIPDYYGSDINLRHFLVLSGLRTFHSCSFCLILLYYDNFICEMHLGIPKFDVAPIVIRYRVTGVLVSAPSRTVDDITDMNGDDDLDDVMRDLMRPIPPSTIHDEVIIPDSLPVPATVTPVLHDSNKKEKQRRVTNQEVLKLQAKVLQHHKEVLLLKGKTPITLKK